MYLYQKKAFWSIIYWLRISVTPICLIQHVVINSFNDQPTNQQIQDDKYFDPVKSIENQLLQINLRNYFSNLFRRGVGARV